MQTMELTDHEAEIIRRVRMTPEERLQEMEACRRSLRQSMTAEQKTEYERIASLAPDVRRAYCLLRQQGAIARELENPSMSAAVEEAREALSAGD